MGSKRRKSPSRTSSKGEIQKNLSNARAYQTRRADPNS